MKFSEKFCKLLALTETQSNELAKVIFVDASQISRMKTGARQRPKSTDILWRLADFFAKRCTSEYRIMEILDFAGKKNLKTKLSERMLAEIIFEWICDDESFAMPSPPLSQLIQKIDNFEISQHNVFDFEDNISLPEPTDKKIVTYYDNEGKRAAVLEFADILLKSDKVYPIYLFTDENIEWMFETPDFLKVLSQKVTALAKKGCLFYRIIPPLPYGSMEYTYKIIERWLPAYMIGMVRDFYYPHLRDNLHRRTVFVAKDIVTVVSHSIANQTQSNITMLSTDSNMTDVNYREVSDILNLCRPAMRVYTTAEAMEMLQCLTNFTAVTADGVYKSSSLSISTMPLHILERVAKENPSPLIEKLFANLRERLSLRNKVLQNYKIKDIFTLSSVEDVLNGKVAIPYSKVIAGNTAFYTPQEYIEHLQTILDNMKQNSNYTAVPIDDDSLKDITIYCKGESNVIMVKMSNPFAIFEIDNSKVATGYFEYINQLIPTKNNDNERKNCITKLKNFIQQINEGLQQQDQLILF